MAYDVIVFDVGKRRLMDILMRGDFAALDGHIEFHLFVNDVTLNPQHTLADLEEMVYSGYSPTLLSGVLEQGIDAADSDTWLWPDVIYDLFSVDQGPTLAFGYFVTHVADGALLWGQNFDVPVVWGSLGDTYVFSPQISLGNCCPGLPPPAFALCAVSSLLRGSAETEFSIDSVLHSVPFATFEVDSVLAETKGTDFDFWSFLSGQNQTDFAFDSLLASSETNTFQVDADLWFIPYPSTFIDSFLINPLEGVCNVSSVLADEATETFSIDALLVEGATPTFTIDSLVLPTPGVLLLYPGSGFVTGPPGIHTWNIWAWGKGSDGTDDTALHGGAGGGGGGFAMRTNAPVTPGDVYHWQVEPVSGGLITLIETDAGIVGATHGGAPAGFPAMPGGKGIGGNVNYFGGHGAVGGATEAGHPGGGGGSAAWMTGTGFPGQVSMDGVGGLGGAGNSTSGDGGQGATPGVGTYGHDGVFPGGGGGGAGSLTGGGSLPAGEGAGGFIVVTWQAAVCFFSSVLKSEGAEDFEVDSFISEQFSVSCGIESFLANEATESFTVDSALVLPGAVTVGIDSDLLLTSATTFDVDSILKAHFRNNFEIDTCIAETFSTDFDVDSVVKDTFGEETSIDSSLKLTSAKTFTVDADLKKTQSKTFTIDSDLKLTSTKTFTIDSLLANRLTKTFTIDSLLATRPTKTFTIDSLLASRPSKTFTLSSYLYNLYLWDTFIDAGNPALSAHTMNVGPGWTIINVIGTASNLAIFSGNHVSQNVDTQFQQAYSDGGVAAGVLRFIFNIGNASGGWIDVLARVQSAGNFVKARIIWDSTHTFKLYSTTGGVDTQLGTATLPTLNTGINYTLTLTVTSSQLTVSISGSDITTTTIGPITNSDFNTQTKWGFGMRRADSSNYFFCNGVSFTVTN